MTDTSASERPPGPVEQSRSSRRSLGIFGGTFDPPHLGHTAVAAHAREELALERLLLMPAHLSPHKQLEEHSGAAQRLRMCELAVAGLAGLAVSSLELDRGGPSYTVDSLEAIHASDPDAELTLIVGADIATTLSSWKQPRRLLELARLAVAARDGATRADVLETVRAIAPAAIGDRLVFLQMPAVRVSSSLLRARLARGESTEGLLDPAVASYIAAHGLYRAGAEAPA